MTSNRADTPREWVLPATPPNVSAARKAVAEHLAGRGVPADVVDVVRIAVSEAITNVVLHAYVDDPEPGAFKLRAGTEDGAVTVTVSDDGRGMIPRHDSPGAGLGLAIIAQLAAGLEIGHSAGGGTELRMKFAA